MNQEVAQQSHSTINEPPTIYRIKEYKANSLVGQFSYMLIRPPRFVYNQQLLHPIESYQAIFKVEEHEIPFKLTLYKVDHMDYVILYLHGNSSSRFQGFMHLKQLPYGVGLACFDFSGCGLRFDSQFITLGMKESIEVDIAAKYLKSLGYKVVGWGRSMGSVSLLLSQQCDILIADSPFYSLNDLCKQSSQKFLPSFCCCCFHCLYPCFFSCVRSDVELKAGLDMKQLQVARLIQQNLRNKQRSLFIMAGIQDNMIHHSHAQKIFDVFPGKKQIRLFQGTHNSQRPSKVLDEAFLFIDRQLDLETKLPQAKLGNIKLKPISKDKNKFKTQSIDQVQQNINSNNLNKINNNKCSGATHSISIQMSKVATQQSSAFQLIPQIKTKLSDKVIDDDQIAQEIKPTFSIQKVRSNKVCPKKQIERSSQLIKLDRDKNQPQKQKVERAMDQVCNDNIESNQQIENIKQEQVTSHA